MYVNGTVSEGGSASGEIPPTREQLAEECKTLTEQHERAQRQLERLDAVVCTAEDELVAHLATRAHYDLLEQTCQTLEKLSEHGVAELFWGEEMTGAAADAHLTDVLARVDGFYVELKHLEDKHRSALSAIEGHREVLDVLDYDLQEVHQLEESRKQEWLIEREPTELKGLRLAMPWMRGFEEDRRFRKTLAASAMTGVLIGLLIPLIDIPIPEREELIEVPERFAKLIRKEPEQPLPPPPPKREKRPEEPLEKVEPEEKVELPPEPAVAVEAKPKSPRPYKKNEFIIFVFD